MRHFMFRHARGGALIALGLFGSACDDGTTGPPRQVLRSVEAYAGKEAQTARTGQAVPVTPVVRVLDTRGKPVFGVTVEWVVTRGGGDVLDATTRTDTSGLASPFEWKLGTVGLNQLEARVGALPAVQFSATATSLPPQPPQPPTTSTLPFNVDLRVVGAITARQQQAVQSAVARWEQAITADLPSVYLNLAAGACFGGQPALSTVVDDLVLYVEFVAIDGAGAVLGEAGPCYVRSESGVPIVGYLKLDAADLDRMERNGTLDDVVLHETGHVLGIGTLWEHLNLLQDVGGTDPRFTGANAVQAYRAMGGLLSGVAVENTGGAGTRDSHWRETEFRNELMTGYVGSVPNPLSALTIASLQDIGYVANPLSASQYTLGSTFGTTVAGAIDLRGREQLRKPKYRVDRNGKRERIED